LNACLRYKTQLAQNQLKAEAILSIESQLGRRRSEDKFAPRTIDIDIILFDGKIIGGHWLSQAFVVVPLAEIIPEFHNPDMNESINETATRLRQSVWMKARRGILN